MLPVRGKCAVVSMSIHSEPVVTLLEEGLSAAAPVVSHEDATSDGRRPNDHDCLSIVKQRPLENSDHIKAAMQTSI